MLCGRPTGALSLKENPQANFLKDVLEAFMKKLFLIMFCLCSLNLFCYSREIDFDYEYHDYKAYAINEKIKVTNKTKELVDFSIYGRFYSRTNDSFQKIIDISCPEKAKNLEIPLNDISIKKGYYQFLKLYTDNDSVSFEISSKNNFINIIITDMPSFEKIQKYPRFTYGEKDTFAVQIDENNIYRFNCMYFKCQKNSDSEVFKRYICFYDYELGKGEKGTPEYIKYKYKLICMPCFTSSQLIEIEKKGKQLYELNMEQKKRLYENIELNPENLSYHAADYPRILTFSRNHEVGKKYIADTLNYYEVSPIGNDNYDIRGSYSRAVFHSTYGIWQFSMSDYQRIITYLGNIDVVRNDGVKLSLPYYECSDKLTSLDRDIEMLVKRNGDWQREIELTDDVRVILNK